MTQELGRLERPSSASFSGKRKLLLVPRLYEPPDGVGEGSAIFQRYWDQVQTQVSSLEARLGPTKHVYYEGLTAGGEDGLTQLQAGDKRGHAFVQARCQTGAILEATEDEETVEETIDLQRCLMMPFSSSKVAVKLHEWFTDGVRRRYEHVSKSIDDTLGENEVGLLLINERHQVQFPKDIEVLFVSPPALDEFRRWLNGWLAQQQSKYDEAAQTGEQESP